MKSTIGILLIVVLVITGCAQDNTPTSPDQNLSKTGYIATGDITSQRSAFPYLQEFGLVKCTWQTEDTNILIQIENQHLFDITNNYFAVIEYSTGNLMIYLNKPEKIDFIIPYLGNEQVQGIKLFAIIEYIK